jgi:ADP-heptose:LPS heptosyltransferase
MLNKIARTALSYYQNRLVDRALSNKRNRPLDLSGSKRFLCLQMNAIGDAIMTQPAWAAIGRAFPDATIDLACSPHIAPLFENDPFLDRIHCLTKGKYRQWVFEDFDGVRQALGRIHYDLLVDFTALPLTAILCAQENMPSSVGFQRFIKGWGGVSDLGRAYDLTYPYSEVLHCRTLMLQLVKSICNPDGFARTPKIYLDRGSIRKASDLLSRYGLKEKSFLVIHPGVKWPPKAWPTRHWQRLIRILQEDRHAPLFLLGGMEDQKTIDEILLDSGTTGVPHYISTDIKLSAALIQLSALCLCHDSAPMHMAAAAGVKTVALFGPVLPSRSAPAENEGCRALHHDMFCSPCVLYYSGERCRRGINFCMHAISPAEVSRAVGEALDSLG